MVVMAFSNNTFTDYQSFIIGSLVTVNLIIIFIINLASSFIILTFIKEIFITFS